jgi:hypothetical protein
LFRIGAVVLVLFQYEFLPRSTLCPMGEFKNSPRGMRKLLSPEVSVIE